MAIESSAATAAAINTSKPPEKRRKSCITCQERKAKCVALPSGDSSTCLSCRDAGLTCVYPTSDPRKKRKKATKPDGLLPVNLSVPPLQDLQGPGKHVEENAPPFVPQNCDTVAYLGFSADFDPHLMQYYKYDDNHVASFFKCSARQVLDDPTFPVQFLAFPDNRGKAVKDAIAAQRKRLKELTRGTEDRLLRLFFQLVYPTYPIVDRKKFYAEYSKGSENIDICLYAGLLAISVIWNKYDEELCVKDLPRQLYDELFDECEIAVERSLKHPTLGTVQGLLLLAQKHIIQSDNSTLFSTNLLMAKLVSVSHTLGLHLDCSEWSISSSEKRLRKRLWATVYLVEKWCSANLGLPSILNDENSTWDEYSEEDPSSLLFVHFGKLTRILDGILKDLYSVKNYADRYKDAASTIKKVDKYFVRLQYWRDDLPLELRDMSCFNANDIKKNGILHLAELTIAVLLHRIKLHPSCTDLLDHETLLKYRTQASTIIKRIVKYTSDIDNPHLKSFWHSMVRLNFSTLLSFVLFHHITSTSKKEFEETKQVLKKWNKTIQGLSKSWAGGTGLAVERASTVFLSGDTATMFREDDTNGLVRYTKDTDRLNEEKLKIKKEEQEREQAREQEKLQQQATSDESPTSMTLSLNSDHSAAHEHEPSRTTHHIDFASFHGPDPHPGHNHQPHPMPPLPGPVGMDISLGTPHLDNHLLDQLYDEFPEYYNLHFSDTELGGTPGGTPGATSHIPQSHRQAHLNSGNSSPHPGATGNAGNIGASNIHHWGQAYDGFNF
ncbi:hypothetical protein DV495_003323 [Geotrichum candidum]|uniref:Similar to Saccharomyces cerevisiae YIR023W DAL81 Positive regulator of genes in multiple nitrogen degradation pathways n=1 Tax=Geotrichum candidum TaxID=1173061 RepID=A0A0J9XB91_GEOCN|nr:hypothetical protein DV452_001300 [Geotrichum candidum]KAI9214802.1 hypothetical protein DS838_000301 [Geotrichum bryndzae]KAF5126674.1 hypothetical protein DV495_003323 [Geotrichum candidum]KAF7501340.1 hypothetical protein DV113_000590 [Geotrichum candidum]KAI8132438.1 hypothetical protein DUD61_003894 [Geotrichum candidum]